MKKLNAKGIFLGANAFGIIEKLEGENATDFLTYIREHMNREDCCVCWRHTLATFRGDFKQFLVHGEAKCLMLMPILQFGHL